MPNRAESRTKRTADPHIIAKRAASEAQRRYQVACAESLRLYVQGHPTDAWREACRIAREAYNAKLIAEADARVVKRAA